MYARFWKRVFDFILSLTALIVLSPLLLLLTVSGAIAMRGNPFFTQVRPGKIDPLSREERLFRLVKFRSMSNEKDAFGKLLPDEKRLALYGKFLRASSLDELPELFNILIGDMSFVGPRPLLVQYLPHYSLQQRRRHEIRPGLTGYAQAYGRNSLSWQEKFEKDVYYVDHVSMGMDIKILFKTVVVVLKREGISSENTATTDEFVGNP